MYYYISINATVQHFTKENKKCKLRLNTLTFFIYYCQLVRKIMQLMFAIILPIAKKNFGNRQTRDMGLLGGVSSRYGAGLEGHK